MKWPAVMTTSALGYRILGVIKNKNRSNENTSSGSPCCSFGTWCEVWNKTGIRCAQEWSNRYHWYGRSLFLVTIEELPVALAAMLLSTLQRKATSCSLVRT